MERHWEAQVKKYQEYDAIVLTEIQSFFASVINPNIVTHIMLRYV